MCALNSCANREAVADDEEVCCDGEDDDCKDDWVNSTGFYCKTDASLLYSFLLKKL